MALASAPRDAWSFGNAILHRALILHCLRKLGPRPFLDRFQRAFDDGQLVIDLRDVEDEDLRALRDCVAELTMMEPDEVTAALRVSYNPDRVHDRMCDFVTFLNRRLDDAP